jgi:hypothetical protein
MQVDNFVLFDTDKLTELLTSKGSDADELLSCDRNFRVQEQYEGC